MTRSRLDNKWYPDPFVKTQDGIEHIIVKLLKSEHENDRLILESEAPYLKLAKDFGLNVSADLTYSEGVLVIPRFDREMTDAGLLLHGQESLVSAKGITEFAHIGRHEDYLAVIRQVSDDPAGDTLEYVMRDVLNFAMGNPDNHGRNTALAKSAGGGVKLTPLFDFAPMKLSDAGIGRSTRWTCLQGEDIDGGWEKICEAAAFEDLSACTIRDALCSKLPFLRDLENLASQAGVREEIIDRAFSAERTVAEIEKLEDTPCPGS